MIENSIRFEEDMKRASELGNDIKVGKYNKIVFCGIGGSAFPGEVVKSLDIGVPVVIVREELPEFVDENTLCFVISYSGNTAETIELYRRAKKKGAHIVIVTSGGKLGGMREDAVYVADGYLPREAFVWLLFPVLNILKVDYRECFKVVKKIDVGFVKKVAGRLIDNIPIVYCSSEKLRFLCYRWQTFFNENSKAFAHSNFFPEIAHNEIEAEDESEFRRILLFDVKSKVVKRACKILKPIEVKLEGKSLIAKIVYGTYFGFLLSYYLAEYEGVDYKEIGKIEGLKD